MLSHSAEATKQIAREIAGGLRGGEVIALIGDLGAGKTTFTQGLVAALGSAAKVKSPTFTVMNEYPAAHGAIQRVVHADFYRMQEAGELRALALDDERRSDTVIVVEWPNAVAADIAPDMTVTITHVGEDVREIAVNRVTIGDTIVVPRGE